LGSFGLSSVVFGDPWAALGAFGRPLGSICHLWGCIGAPLARHWAPFVAFGVPLGRLWASLGLTLRSLGGHFGLKFPFSVTFRTFVVLGIFKENTKNKASQL